MLFPIFNNANIQFTKKELTWRTYTTKKVLLTTRQVKFINQKKFVKVVLDENIKAFVEHVSFLRLRITNHLAEKA